MIYFIRDEKTRHIKIGFTAGSGAVRARDLQTGCPGQLVLLLEIQGSKQDEAAWHERFASARIRDPGEWFKPAPQLLLAIAEAKILQLEERNAQLQASLDVEKERAHEAKMKLAQLSAFGKGQPSGQPGVFPQANASRLELECARLQAQVEAERKFRKWLVDTVRDVAHMLDG